MLNRDVLQAMARHDFASAALSAYRAEAGTIAPHRDKEVGSTEGIMNDIRKVFFLAPFLFLACEDSVTRPVASEVSRPPEISQNGSMEDVTESVTGSFHSGSSGVWTTRSFHGLRRADGSVEGTFHTRRHRGAAGGAKISGPVVCMVIEGNQAWLAGVATKALGEVNIGRAYGFWVKDSGEGRNAPPDQFAYPATGPGAGPGGWLTPPLVAGSPPDPASAMDFCEEQPTPTTFITIEAGNIQVHGSKG